MRAGMIPSRLRLFQARSEWCLFLAPSSWSGVLSAKMSNDLTWPVAQGLLFREASRHTLFMPHSTLDQAGSAELVQYSQSSQ